MDDNKIKGRFLHNKLDYAPFEWIRLERNNIYHSKTCERQMVSALNFRHTGTHRIADSPAPS